MDQLLSNLTDGMLLFDQQDRLVMTTPSAARFLSRPPETLLRHTATEIFTGGGPLETLLRRAFEEGRSFSWKVVETGGQAPRRVVEEGIVGDQAERQGSGLAGRGP